MAGFFDGTTTRYLSIVDNSALNLPSSGWSIVVMFYPDTTVTVNTFGYIYSHGVPASGVDALNIIRDASGVRVIIDTGAGTFVDLTTSNNFVNDQWNNFAVVYDGFDLFMVLNGITTAVSPSFFGTLTPSGDARIGYSVQGGTREFNGRLCHVTKFDRALTVDERTKYTSIFVSPDFAQQDKIWHIPLWNSDFTYDQQNVLTVNQVSMAFGPHAPASYPTSTLTALDAVPEPTEQRRRLIYVGA